MYVLYYSRVYTKNAVYTDKNNIILTKSTTFMYTGLNTNASVT